jgi:D-3-phosphoglycerate dehydrogenase / 2-oxoglutarate reductase
MKAPFKVALVGLDSQTVPDSVVTGLAAQAINLVVHECENREDLAQWGGDADVVWVFGSSRCLHGQMSPEELSILPKCGAIIRTGSGTDNVPVKAATRLGIVVANTPDALNDAVSDHAIGLLFAVVRQIALQDRNVRNRIWDRTRGYPNWHLTGRTLGLVGFGRIARTVAQKLAGFQMTNLAYDPFVLPEVFDKHSVHSVSLDELFRRSDFVSIHCPLIPQTRHLIGRAEFEKMKREAILINTSRGPVIDESALIVALKSGQIAGAGLDVLETEPPEWDNPLLQLDNVVLTPHLGGYSDRYLPDCWRLSMETAIDLWKGKWPRSCVNPEVQPRWNLTR